MIKLPKALIELADSFKELPVIGSKTAERLSYFILENDLRSVERFSRNLLSIDREIEVCNICFFLVEKAKIVFVMIV